MSVLPGSILAGGMGVVVTGWVGSGWVVSVSGGAAGAVAALVGPADGGTPVAGAWLKSPATALGRALLQPDRAGQPRWIAADNDDVALHHLAWHGAARL